MQFDIIIYQIAYAKITVLEEEMAASKTKRRTELDAEIAAKIKRINSLADIDTEIAALKAEIASA